ncbi:MAG TPA: hypothetical protein VF352_05745 [Anaerolineales bacterium]|jgi:hypothetical protein
MKDINLGASPELFLSPQAAGYWTRDGIKETRFPRRREDGQWRKALNGLTEDGYNCLP